jgi:DNA repair photolyase
MIRSPIYKPKGRANEYGDLAVNIYTECNLGCTYCFAEMMAKGFGRPWTGEVKPRKDIVLSVKRQLTREKITGKLIHLQEEIMK